MYQNFAIEDSQNLANAYKGCLKVFVVQKKYENLSKICFYTYSDRVWIDIDENTIAVFKVCPRNN